MNPAHTVVPAATAPILTAEVAQANIAIPEHIAAPKHDGTFNGQQVSVIDIKGFNLKGQAVHYTKDYAKDGHLVGLFGHAVHFDPKQGIVDNKTGVVYRRLDQYRQSTVKALGGNTAPAATQSTPTATPAPTPVATESSSLGTVALPAADAQSPVKEAQDLGYQLHTKFLKINDIMSQEIDKQSTSFGQAQDAKADLKDKIPHPVSEEDFNAIKKDPKKLQSYIDWLKAKNTESDKAIKNYADSQKAAKAQAEQLQELQDLPRKLMTQLGIPSFTGN